jgi:hypothetical protein
LDESVTEVPEVLLHAGLPGLSDRHHADHGSNPDRDAEDRERAAQLVPEQRPDGCANQSG